MFEKDSIRGIRCKERHREMRDSVKRGGYNGGAKEGYGVDVRLDQETNGSTEDTRFTAPIDLLSSAQQTLRP